MNDTNPTTNTTQATGNTETPETREITQTKTPKAAETKTPETKTPESKTVGSKTSKSKTSETAETAETSNKPRHFITQIIEADLADHKQDKIIVRFPPEPNGYLHIGHAKSICLNFGLAQQYNGDCYLRFDDTNPIKEEEEYVRAIIEDVHWLGFDWGDKVRHASDYFEQLYDYAVQLIKQGNAYVDSLSAEEIRAHRGTLQKSGHNSPYRDRSVEENLALFEGMRAGKFKEGEHILRAKIDMTSGNINMRDPAIYRIRFASHQRTGDTWCIYPLYDFAHPLSDAIEQITHSLCTLEFQDHRPLYDWLINALDTPAKPQQTEFARLNISHTITSKRKLKQLVDEKLVDSWDDPRLPTLRGMRRRGYPPAAIRHFCEMIGLSKSDSVIDMSVLEECVRDELNQHAPRAMAVLNPLKVVIENFPEGETQMLSAQNHPNQPEMGTREIPFTREIYIEHDDFMMEPPKKFFRLGPGREVRLRHGYIIRCERVVTDDASGEVKELRCVYDPDTLGKNPTDRKVKGVIHWVSAQHAIPAHVRLYDRLFTVNNPAGEDDLLAHVNPDSLKILTHCWLEPSLANAKPADSFQFERLGYFTVDPTNSNASPKPMIINRIVNLRDTWAKLQR